MKPILFILLICAVCSCAAQRRSRLVGGGLAPPTLVIESVIVREPDVDRLPVPKIPIEGILQYPFEMRRAGLVGSVVARLAIDKEGRVGDVVIIRSTQREFEPAVVHGARSIPFFPAVTGNHTVACEVDYEFKFHFDDE